MSNINEQMTINLNNSIALYKKLIMCILRNIKSSTDILTTDHHALERFDMKKASERLTEDAEMINSYLASIKACERQLAALNNITE